MTPDKRKADIRWSISQNPVTISINRTAKIRQGGGFKEVKSTVGPFVVRIFQGRQQQLTTSSEMIGTQSKGRTYSLLAPHDADIRSGTDVLDTFEAPGIGSFKVSEVIQEIVAGQVCGYQVDIERVS